MSESAGENLNSSIEKLVDRMEKMYERQASGTSRDQDVILLLERLSYALTRLEDGRGVEAEIAKKIDLLNKTLERTIDVQERTVMDRESSGITLDRVISGVKIIGLVLSTLASSIQTTVDNINTVLDKNKSAGALEADGTKAAKTQADLASILQPVSSLVKNLVEERLKQGQGEERESVPAEEPASGKEVGT